MNNKELNRKKKKEDCYRFHKCLKREKKKFQGTIQKKKKKILYLDNRNSKTN